MEPTPRINSALLDKYQGKNVRIVGRIIRFDDKVGIIETSDGGQVQVNLATNSRWCPPYIELISRVEPNRSLTELWSTSFGDTFDLGLADKAVLACQQYPDIF